MKNIKILVIIYVLVIISVSLKAQVVQLHYQNCSNCPQGQNSNTSLNDTLFLYVDDVYESSDIESDFDRREANGDSRWHKGLDFRDQGVDASRYTNVVHNLDSIEIKIRKNDNKDEFDIILDPAFQSEFLLHAKEGTGLYPNALFGLNHGRVGRTGCDPSAYRDGVGFRPYVEQAYLYNFLIDK